MSRWQKVEARHRDDLVRDVRAAAAPSHVGGTIRPEQVLIGKCEMVAEAEQRGLSLSQAYAVVNTMCAQSFMVPLSVGSLQFKGTVVSSAGHWFTEGRFKLAENVRKDRDWSKYGRLGGRGNNKKA